MAGKLPHAFVEQIRSILGSETDEFLKSFTEPRANGLRVNTLKTDINSFAVQAPWKMEPVVWSETGFYYDHAERPAEHPLYAAGAFYIQEPSAMIAAELLPVREGGLVLDLCAAPGGKATRLAEKLGGKGLLVANDPVRKRATVLLANLERHGAANILVTSEDPGRLSERFGEFFDSILVDAPCSGEGMFRKNEEAVRDWSPEKVVKLSRLQKDILENAVSMLKPGGHLLYSTCTFSPEENEENVACLLRKHPEMELIQLPHPEGTGKGFAVSGLTEKEAGCLVRLFPHKARAEGHFAALFVKNGERLFSPGTKKKRSRPGRQSAEEIEKRRLLSEFIKAGDISFNDEDIVIRNDKALLIGETARDITGLKYIRNGLLIGEFKAKRFEPSQALAYYLSGKGYRFTLSMKADDSRVERYLRGETIEVPEVERWPENCWILVCAEGFSLGFGKLSGNRLKNKYLYRKKA